VIGPLRAKRKPENTNIIIITIPVTGTQSDIFLATALWRLKVSWKKSETEIKQSFNFHFSGSEL
jgi:hypothetical protein